MFVLVRSRFLARRTTPGSQIGRLQPPDRESRFELVHDITGYTSRLLHPVVLMWFRSPRRRGPSVGNWTWSPPNSSFRLSPPSGPHSHQKHEPLKLDILQLQEGFYPIVPERLQVKGAMQADMNGCGLAFSIIERRQCVSLRGGGRCCVCRMSRKKLGLQSNVHYGNRKCLWQIEHTIMGVLGLWIENNV